MKRIIFLIDGFNLYHSIKEIEEYGIKAKWLNIQSLFSSYLHLFGKDAVLNKIYYFSALPDFLQKSDPDKLQRHKEYILCLENTGIKKELGRFKNRKTFCQKCRSSFNRKEEKETDVSIGVKMFEVFYKNECEVLVIVSGDTDLVPAVKICKENFPNKEITFCFPFKRKMNELAFLSTIQSFSINKKQYIRHQFPNPYKLKSGRVINKPLNW